MNTRTFKKVVIDLHSLNEKFDKVNKLNLETSEEHTDKYDLRTYRQDKRPVYKYYRYKS